VENNFPIKIIVSEDEANVRLDKFVAKKLNITRSQTKKLNEEKFIKLNSSYVKPDKILKANDVIEIFKLPEKEITSSIEPENLPIDIVYEDEHVLVVNKPANLVVHPSPTLKVGTLVNRLLAYTKNLSTIGGEYRRGIVHRLDKGTSGIIIIAKTDIAHISLINQFKERKVEKIYQVLVHGNVEKEYDKISTLIGRHTKLRHKFTVAEKEGKEAVTIYQVEKRFKFATLLRVELKTGRTHQIKVHMAYIHHPVFGDTIYGGKKYIKDLKNNIITRIDRQAIHSKMISFIHPITNKKMSFEVDLPLDMKKCIEELEKYELNT
jgi:23S rRNA pseudouridine1911/1915/1917 synthase